MTYANVIVVLCSILTQSISDAKDTYQTMNERSILSIDLICTLVYDVVPKK